MISCRGHHDQLQRSPKSAAEAFIALSLVWDYQKGIICRGKYALFGLVWFGGHQNQLQRSPLHYVLLLWSSCSWNLTLIFIFLLPKTLIVPNIDIYDQ